MIWYCGTNEFICYWYWEWWVEDGLYVETLIQTHTIRNWAITLVCNDPITSLEKLNQVRLDLRENHLLIRW